MFANRDCADIRFFRNDRCYARGPSDHPLDSWRLRRSKAGTKAGFPITDNIQIPLGLEQE